MSRGVPKRGVQVRARIPPLAPTLRYGREQQAALAKHGEGHKPMLPEWESSQIPSRGMSPGSRLSSARQPRSLTPQ